MLDVIPDLPARWAALREENPRLRIRDAAARLGVPEAALVDAIPGRRRLRPDWAGMLQALEAAGPVMALTRNGGCVHERHGTYRNVSAENHVALVLGEEIDLRLFLARWKHGFFTPAGQPGSPRGALQVFDASGEAVHKIFATERTGEGALERIAAALDSSEEAPLSWEAPAAPAAPRPDAEVDAAGLRAAWAALQDTHDFFPLLRRFKAHRLQAFRLAGTEWARPLPAGSVERALTEAAAAALPVMVFVGNAGCIQIHTGPVNRIVPMEGWFNVLDPDFNLHLRPAAIQETWLVRKPTADGTVTSVEAFDAGGNAVITLFGKRKPGQPEDLDWRALAEGLAP